MVGGLGQEGGGGRGTVGGATGGAAGHQRRQSLMGNAQKAPTAPCSKGSA